MATFKNATTSIAAADTTFSTVYTAPGIAVIHAMYISNNSIGSNAEVTLQVNDGSSGIDIPILDRVPIRSNTTLVLEKPINLETGDSIKIKSATGVAVTAFASVMEV
jgi:hypothetical protein